MEGGTLAEALADFTSGLSEMIELKNNGYEDEEKRNSLRKMLLHEHEEHSLMCSAITVCKLLKIISQFLAMNQSFFKNLMIAGVRLLFV